MICTAANSEIIKFLLIRSCFLSGQAPLVTGTMLTSTTCSMVGSGGQRLNLPPHLTVCRCHTVDGG